MKAFLFSLLFACSMALAGPVCIWGPGPTAKCLAPLATPAGTALLPGVTVGTDQTSGLFSIGTGDIALSAGGIQGMEALKVGTNVNFGFGPPGTVSVAASNPFAMFSSNNGGQFWQFGNTSVGANAYTGFQFISGTPNVAVAISIENHAYHTTGYLATSSLIAAGSGIGTNFIISNNAAAGNVTLSTGGSPSASTERVKIDSSGHLNTHGSAPALGACGTTPAIAGNDDSGVITVGTGGVATSCAITFAATYTTIPHCFVSDETQIVALQVVPTATTLTITAAAAFTASSKLDYFCVNHY